MGWLMLLLVSGLGFAIVWRNKCYRDFIAKRNEVAVLRRQLVALQREKVRLDLERAKLRSERTSTRLQ